MATVPQRINLATVISIALIAFGLQSVVHEVLGHTIVAWLTGTKVVLISSTAMQTVGGGKWVPASGPLASLAFGIAAYLALRRMPRFGAWRLFLWIFAFANLFLSTGYILYSGLFNFGDSAIVIAGLRPAWLYRALLVVAGALGYRYSVRLAAGDLLDQIRKSRASSVEVLRILYASCVAGVLLYLVASFFNPVSRSLILYDGVSEASGVAIGFVLLARIVQGMSQKTPASPASDLTAPSIPFSLAWVTIASAFAVLFVVFMGRGIRILKR
jgi:hypothetical protein